MTLAATLNAWAELWASFMVRTLLDSTALLAAVVAVWLPLRRRISAQFAHGLFLIVLLKLAVPIPTAWPSWSAEASLRRVAARVSTWGAPGPAEVAANPGPIDEPGEAPIVAVPPPEPIITVAASPAPRASAVPASPATSPAAPAPPALTLSAGLMLAWAAVALGLLVRFGRSVRATRRLLRGSTPVDDGSGCFPVDFEALRRAAGVRSGVGWAISERVAAPAVGGLIRPTVVMPPDLDAGLTPKQINWILLHELAHIRRGDLWVITLQRLMNAAFFFHPAAHLANWAIDQLREYACDDAALSAAQASRHACGEGFLTIVGRTAGPEATPALTLGLFESKMLIHRRLVRILDSRRPVHARLSPLATAALVVLALVILPYGRPGGVAATSTPAAPRLAATPDEPRLYGLGATFLHDDRADSAGRPRQPVLAVACAPDGRSLATAGEDGIIAVRDLPSGAVRARLEGHGDVVTCLAYSPDGRTLASGGYDATVRLWDAATGRLRVALTGHDRWVFALAFSPDGRTLASGGTDRAVRLWDAETGRPLGSLAGATSAIRALGFASDGRTLASGGADRVATLWDLATRAPRATLAGHRGTIRALAFDAGGGTLATAGEDGEVRLWDARSGRERATLTGHGDMVLALAFGPTGATLASGGMDATIRLWDARTGRERAALAAGGDGVPALAFNAAARQIVSTGYDGSVRLWDAAAPTLAPAATLDQPGEGLEVAFAPDGGRLFATTSARSLVVADPHAGLILDAGEPGRDACLAVTPDGSTVALGTLDGTIRLVEAATRREVAALDGHRGEVRALAIGRGGRLLASGGRDGRVVVWDLAARARSRELPAAAGPITALQFAPDASTLAVAAEGGPAGATIYDPASGESLGFVSHRGAVAGLAFAPDGRTLALIGGDGTIARVDASTRSVLATWTHPGGQTVAFSPDGRFLATGHRGGEGVLWDAASGRKLATLRGHSGPIASLAFAPDGRTVASTGRDRTLRVWDLGARKVTPRGTLTSPDRACVGPVVVTPDGRTLASAEVAHDSAGRIVLWDLATGRPRAVLLGHERGVLALACSPDGSTLASSSADLSVRLWDVASGSPRGEIIGTEAASRLAFSPDGKTLALAGEDRTLALRDIATGEELARLEGFRGPIGAVAFAPDGGRIATAGGRDGRANANDEVKILDARTLEVLADLRGHAGSVRSLAFAPDGLTLATGGADATVRLWDGITGQPRLVLGGFPDCVRALRYAPDGRTLAVAGRGDGVVALIDPDGGSEVARLIGHGGPVLGLAFTPDGRTLATGSLDASIKLWDVPASRTALARR